MGPTSRTSRRAPRRSLAIPAVVAGIVLLGLGLSPEATAGGLYTFVDSRGVVHFSDVPHDARYEPLTRKPRELAFAPAARGEAPTQDAFDGLIAQTARSFGVDPALVKAVIAAESAFQTDAVSRAGAQGLMQLMPRTAEELGVTAPFEPEENVLGGVRYLRAMLDRYGDVRRALAAYNAGPDAVDRHEGIPPYPETKAYVRRVLNYYRGYQDQFSF